MCRGRYGRGHRRYRRGAFRAFPAFSRGQERDSGQAHRTMTDDRLQDPLKVEWEGKYIRIVTRGGWEYVERCCGVSAAVILAEYDGKVILIEQSRVPLG